MSESLKSKLQKLLTLSKRGVDGEKLNAEFLLKRLLKKHNISISEIESDVREKRYYTYTTNESKTIVAQVLYNVLNVSEIYQVKCYKELCVEASEYEDVLIKEMIDFHLGNFKKEKKKLLKDLTEAYVYKHNLFSDQKSNSDPDPAREIDWEKLQRVLQLKGTLEDVSFQKRLNS